MVSQTTDDAPPKSRAFKHCSKIEKCPKIDCKKPPFRVKSGSANLTRSGVASLHVEAGITLDTEDGDSGEFLNSIAEAVDLWFETNPPGLHRVATQDDIAQLAQDGILSETRPTRPARPAAVGTPESLAPQARLRPLIAVPAVIATPSAQIVAPRTQEIILPASPRADFPQYILFAPNATTPTHGPSALSGASLPAGAVGLILRLNRDSTRHFDNRGGTANISVPVATLGTFRFGLYVGQYTRPRAEFSLVLRYIGPSQTFRAAPEDTGIMVYGFLPGESGHGDVRMVLPRPPTRQLAEAISSAGGHLPREGDFALLEWPTTNSARELRMSF